MTAGSIGEGKESAKSVFNDRSSASPKVVCVLADLGKIEFYKVDKFGARGLSSHRDHSFRDSNKRPTANKVLNPRPAGPLDFPPPAGGGGGV